MRTSKNEFITFGITLIAAFIMVAMPELASASGDGGLGGMMCRVVGWFSGDTGKAIATLAIVVLGIAAFFGKVTWGMALMFGVGIFAIFGASELVGAISGEDGNCSTS